MGAFISRMGARIPLMARPLRLIGSPMWLMGAPISRRGARIPLIAGPLRLIGSPMWLISTPVPFVAGGVSRACVPMRRMRH
jgi:hypothetical protein